MNCVLKNNLLRKGLAGAAGAVIAIASLSACTDYVAQMESDFEVWASQQGGTYPQGGDYPEWGGDELPPPSSSSTSYNTSSIVTGSLLDERDGQIYKTVVIGTQVWMAQNLNYASDFYMSYCYDNLPSNCAKYGRLYSWSAAMDSLGVFSANGKGCGDWKYGTQPCSPVYPVRGVCPSGWHLPDSNEIKILYSYVDGYADEGMKLRATSGWDYNRNGSDAYGFSALPAGMRSDFSGEFSFMGSLTDFWGSTPNPSAGSGCASQLTLYDGNGGTRAYGGLGCRVASYAISVRCVQN